MCCPASLSQSSSHSSAPVTVPVTVSVTVQSQSFSQSRPSYQLDGDWTGIGLSVPAVDVRVERRRAPLGGRPSSTGLALLPGPVVGACAERGWEAPFGWRPLDWGALAPGMWPVPVPAVDARVERRGGLGTLAPW